MSQTVPSVSQLKKEEKEAVIFYQPANSDINNIVKNKLFEKGKAPSMSDKGYCWYMALLSICESMRTDIDKALQNASAERKKCWEAIKCILDMKSEHRRAGKWDHKPVLDKNYANGLIAINRLLDDEYSNMIFKFRGIKKTPKGKKFARKTYSGTKKISIILNKLLGDADGKTADGKIAYVTLSDKEDRTLDPEKYELVGITAGYFRTTDTAMHQVAWMKHDDGAFKLYDSVIKHAQEMDQIINVALNKAHCDKEEIEKSESAFASLKKVMTNVVGGEELAKKMYGYLKPGSVQINTFAEVWHLRGSPFIGAIYVKRND
jgi:hypothetical protein